jgi:hypothetical protein
LNLEAFILLGVKLFSFLPISKIFEINLFFNSCGGIPKLLKTLLSLIFFIEKSSDSPAFYVDTDFFILILLLSVVKFFKFFFYSCHFSFTNHTQISELLCFKDFIILHFTKDIRNQHVKIIK